MPSGGPPIRRRAAAVRAACSAVAVAVAAGGCALVSVSGAVHQVDISQAGSGGQCEGNPQLIPAGPGENWTPPQIVDGFLEASASFADNFAIARRFLTKSEASTWQPKAVTVVGDLSPSAPGYVPKRQTNQQSQKVLNVSVTGAQLATLTGSGQYLTSSGATQTYNFELIKTGSSWRINAISIGLSQQQPPITKLLMLTQDEFQHVYQQRNLYFIDPLAGHKLVPDPVFVPQNDTCSDLATRLVKGLLNNPQGWLADAARTAFPRGTKLSGPVSINGPNATVSLAVPGPVARSMTQARKGQLAAQLVWTLTSTSYGPTPIQIVEIQVNGHTLTRNGVPFQRPKQYQSWVPGQTSPVGPYFISRSGVVKILKMLSPAGSDTGQPGSAKFTASPVPGQAGGLAVPSLRAIAVKPQLGELAGLSADGKDVYIGDLSRGAPLTRQQRLGGSYSSLSWSSNSDLWVAGGSSVWVLTPNKGSENFNQQEIPSLLNGSQRLIAFRVAPDGVRVAMIVRINGQFEVWLGAISWHNGVAFIGPRVIVAAQIPSPRDLTWYDADHVIVLTQAGKPQLEEIPLNGGALVHVSTVSGTTSVTAGGGILAAGLANGKLAVEPEAGALWQPVGVLGRGPAYPG